MEDKFEARINEVICLAGKVALDTMASAHGDQRLAASALVLAAKATVFAALESCPAGERTDLMAAFASLENLAQGNTNSLLRGGMS